jgi:uncharacterized OB-fold protein
VVLELTKKIENRNHSVNIDNFFISFGLFQILRNRRTFAKGTARCNRKNFPKHILTLKCVKVQGDLKMAQRGKIAAYAWKDK